MDAWRNSLPRLLARFDVMIIRPKSAAASLADLEQLGFVNKEGLLFQIPPIGFWHCRDRRPKPSEAVGCSVAKGQLFSARTTVPVPIFRCSANALTLQPRWRSWTASSRLKIFLGRRIGCPDFVPCSRAHSNPAITRSRITDRSSSAMAANDSKHGLAHRSAGIERLLMTNEFDPKVRNS